MVPPGACRPVRVGSCLHTVPLCADLAIQWHRLLVGGRCVLVLGRVLARRCPMSAPLVGEQPRCGLNSKGYRWCLIRRHLHVRGPHAVVATSFPDGGQPVEPCADHPAGTVAREKPYGKEFRKRRGSRQPVGNEHRLERQVKKSLLAEETEHQHAWCLFRRVRASQRLQQPIQRRRRPILPMPSLKATIVPFEPCSAVSWFFVGRTGTRFSSATRAHQTVFFGYCFAQINTCDIGQCS